MLKNVSSMKNMRFGFEESDEENNEHESGLGRCIREIRTGG